MFSTIIDVPLAVVNIAENTDCISVGNPGYGMVFMSNAFIFLLELIFILFFSISILQSASCNFVITGVMCSAFVFSNIKFPFVATAKHKKVPVSILSGIML